MGRRSTKIKERSGAPASRVDRPMFILGPPRCGTSLLYRCIGSHPDVGYIHRAGLKLANHPRIGRALIRMGWLANEPHEGRPIWDRFHPGGPDGASAEDVTPEVIHWYHDYVTRLLAAGRVQRFVAKLPAHTLRVPWLNAVFPDAIFVQILRDWRSAVASTVAKRRRDAESGKWADVGGWFGLAPPGWQQHVDEPFSLGAAWQYCAGHEILEEQRAQFGERWVRVAYEDLCNDPALTMERLTERCGLRWDQETRGWLPRDIRPASERWRAELEPDALTAIREEYGKVLEVDEFSTG